MAGSGDDARADCAALAFGHAARRQGVGGRAFDVRLIEGLQPEWPGSLAADITLHGTAAPGIWTDARIERATLQGISRDGRKLQAPMPLAYYARLRSSELDALVAYLRTSPPPE
ncbi:MAG: hypothetical protein JSW31_13645 [Burkholderiales bacterium]|nr:MAG: hypothetical protein JSW31_13645 [Burkholderiales bacterium]